MSKKRTSATQGRGRQVATPNPVKQPAGGADVTPWTYAVVGVAAFIAFAMIFGWTAVVPYILAPLVTGVFVALCLQSPAGSAAVAGLAGLVSAAVCAIAYVMPAFYERAIAPPPDTNNDIPGMLWQIVGGFMQNNPLNTMPQPTGMLLLLGCGALGTAAVAWGTATLVRKSKGDQTALRRRVGAGIVAVVCLSYAFSAARASTEMIAYANQEPVVGNYAFDATVYLKTYYNMAHGQDYYTALVSAAAGDTRVIADTATGIRDGKSYGGWLWGPSAARRPTIFYVWKYLAPGGGGSVIYLAIAFSALSLAVIWWGLTPYLSYRAVFVPIFAVPYVMLMTLGLNVFFPDYWAALIALCALALLMRRQWIAGAAALLFAAAVRETIGPSLAVMAVVLVLVWLRCGKGREWLVRAGAFAAAAALWLGFEKVHEAIGTRFMAVPYPSSFDILMGTMQGLTWTKKVTGATQYLVFPYGFYAIPGLVSFLLAPVGYWAALASRKDVQTAVTGYAVYWVVFLSVVGATSSYWGQALMLPSLVGVACLLLSADRLNKRLEMTEPIA